MATFKMPAKCYVCEKRCDGHFFCSEKCREAYVTHNKMKALGEALGKKYRQLEKEIK